MKRFTALLAVFVLGCATTQQVRPAIETERIYAQPFDKVWGATVATLTQTYPVKAIEKSSGLITTDFVALGVKQYGYAPSVMLGCWSDGRHYITALVKNVDDGHASVKLVVHLEGFEFNVTHSWYVWESNGQLEAELFGKISSSI